MRKRLDKEDRRRQICDTARRLFIEKGFENVSMKDINKALNISVGGLYHHYANLNEILKDLVVNSQEYKNNLLASIRSKNPEMSLDEAMIETVVYLLFDKSEYSMLYVMFLIAAKSDDNLLEVSKELFEKSKQEYLLLLEHLGTNEYRCFINDEFISFINSVKIGNYYLKNNSDAEATREVYRNFVSLYLENNRQA